MRVFLDTNVLASALATRGLCADILREVMSNHVLVVSEPLLSELQRILPRKFKIPPSVTKEMVEFFRQDLIDAADDQLLEIKINDKDDIAILSSAFYRRAEAFVTGDKEVLALKHIEDMKIYSPRDFWDRRRSQKKA
ncbi:MAG: putative toxin-antitoxin system toxin component, PIN family [Kiritimatiellae bacterium]|nr:putative toxin-antitoxin system toxin component, PIN family [Kiritimatiellia bacterium]